MTETKVHRGRAGGGRNHKVDESQLSLLDHAASRSIDTSNPSATPLLPTSVRSARDRMFRLGLAASASRQIAAPAPKQLLDVRSAAAWLGLSKSTLDKMRCTGEGPKFIRATAKAVRYDPADLAAFANDRRQLRTSDRFGA